jgi:hypothetical protein
VAPQSPARATARASASARVSPPGAQPANQEKPSGPPYGDLITPGSGQPPGGPASPFAPGQFTGPEQYSEHTTDIAGRGESYVPAPALPAFPPQGQPFPQSGQPQPGQPFPQPGQPQPGHLQSGHPQSGHPQSGHPQSGPPFGQPEQQQFPQAEFGQGGFPQARQPGDNEWSSTGPATRATVTPPRPEDTTSWPGVEAQGNRFDQPESPPKPETPHVRMLPILIAVVVGAGLLVGLAFGIVYLVAGGNDDTPSVSLNTGDCVKKSGDTAVKADCGDATAYKVVSVVDDKSKCADPQQPYVLNPSTDGKTQVLCLKANG